MRRGLIKQLMFTALTRTKAPAYRSTGVALFCWIPILDSGLWTLDPANSSTPYTVGSLASRPLPAYMLKNGH